MISEFNGEGALDPTKIWGKTPRDDPWKNVATNALSRRANHRRDRFGDKVKIEPRTLHGFHNRKHRDHLQHGTNGGSKGWTKEGAKRREVGRHLKDKDSTNRKSVKDHKDEDINRERHSKDEAGKDDGKVKNGNNGSVTEDYNVETRSDVDWDPNSP